MDDNKNSMLKLTADVVAAYVSKNAVPAADLPALIGSVHGSLNGLGSPAAPAEPVKKPAVTIKKSVLNDQIICPDCGKRFKSIKRHLSTKHDLTPAEYRQKWHLLSDYPMVAPKYGEARSVMAKKMGLGRARAAKGKQHKKAAKR